MPIDKELLKGSTDMLVLSLIHDEPLYGYEISKRLRAASKTMFAFGEGTLYPMLHKLERERLCESYWQEHGGRRRKYYLITKKGKRMLEQILRQILG